MLPRLQRFYGGTPKGWANMPTGLLRRYIEEMPRLEAEERLADLTMALIATGKVKPREIKRIERQYESKAGRKKARKFDSLEGVESIGIKVIREV